MHLKNTSQMTTSRAVEMSYLNFSTPHNLIYRRKNLTLLN